MTLCVGDKVRIGSNGKTIWYVASVTSEMVVLAHDIPWGKDGHEWRQMRRYLTGQRIAALRRV